MQTRRRSESALKKQLIQQVTQSHAKILDESAEIPRRIRSSTPKSGRPRKRRTEPKQEEPKPLEKQGSIINAKFFLASSLEADKQLYMEAQNNPAALAYLKDKLKQSMVYDIKDNKVVLDKSGALFARSLLLKNEQIKKNDDNGQLTSIKLSSQKPKDIKNDMPDPDDLHNMSPTFGPLMSQKSSVKKLSVGKSSMKQKMGNQDQIDATRKRKLISNSLCFKILLMNLIFFALSIWPIMSIQGFTSSEPRISENIIDERGNSSEKSLNEQERLYDLNMEFKKMNQELEAFIAEIENPKVSSDFQMLLPFSVTFLCLQLLVWGTYLSIKS